jgi:glutamyl-tRNA reductase
MRLFAVGVSHRTAPVELRETIDFTRRGLGEAIEGLRLRNLAREAVVLSTCNRAEIYAGAESEAAAESCGRFISEFNGVAWDALAPHLVIYRGPEAADHLFRVAAGLDSLVVGEPQILGQVKDAFSTASELKATGALTHRLFTTAFSVGKRVRSETGLGEGAVSVSYAAIALAKKIFGRLKGLNVLVLGAGEMATLARELKGQAVPWTSVPHALSAADIVVTATGSPDPVLSRAMVEDAMRPRRGRPLFLIDIALPRDVEPEAGSLDQVFLYNIDDLQGIVKENLARRSSEVQRAESIVREEVDRFRAWMQSRDVVPTVVALRQQFEAIRRSELQRLDAKLAQLPPEARARVDEITHLIVEKLLLTPTEQLKEAEDEATALAYSDALNRLFKLPRKEDE